MATACAARQLGRRISGKIADSQASEIQIRFGIGIVVMQLLETIDRVEEDQSAVASLVAGTSPHAVREAHERLDGSGSASDVVPARLDLRLHEVEVLACPRILS